MSGCTATGKPLIAILMAVYEPQLDWLREQLESLEKQTYPNLKLYVRDDCSETVSFEEIERCIKEYIHSFPYEIQRNEANLGSNRTFERLTEEAEGTYFAYCDQDDVWLPEKLEVLQEELERTGALLVCSDMYIIDGQGKQIADSITQVRRRHVFREGTKLMEHLLVRNFIVGCTMLACAETAKSAVPFEPGYVHDQWIGIVAASKGRILSIKKPLISYRQHGNNQTGILSGINSKEDYLRIRIKEQISNVQSAISRLDVTEDERIRTIALKRVLDARERYFLKPNVRDLKIFLSNRVFSREALCFEVILPFLPSRLYQKIIAAVKRETF